MPLTAPAFARSVALGFRLIFQVRLEAMRRMPQLLINRLLATEAELPQSATRGSFARPNWISAKRTARILNAATAQYRDVVWNMEGRTMSVRFAALVLISLPLSSRATSSRQVSRRSQIAVYKAVLRAWLGACYRPALVDRRPSSADRYTCTLCYFSTNLVPSAGR